MTTPQHLITLERHLPALHQACLRWAARCCGGETEEGEDLVQELYVRLWDGRVCPPPALCDALELKGEGEQKQALRAWLFSVIRRLASNHLRTLKRRLRLLKSHASLLSDHETHDARNAESELILAQERAEERGATQAALAQLSRRQREVIELVFHHQLTLEQASEVMGLSLGSARAHYDRAKRRLAGLLSPPQRAHLPPSLPLTAQTPESGEQP